MKKDRIENAIDIIDYAIKNGVAVTKASTHFGYRDTYVKNVKKLVKELNKENKISEKKYNSFINRYDEYLISRNNKPTNIDINTNELNVNKKKEVKGEQIKFKEDGDVATIDYVADAMKFNETLNCDNNAEHEYPSGHIKSLDRLLEKCDVDLKYWTVKDYVVNKWDVTSWKTGHPHTVENFQVKARLEKIKEQFEAKDVAEIFKELVEDYTPPKLTQFNSNWRENKNKININDIVKLENNMLEISLFDLHLGKLGWKGETGENFDVKIASERFLNAIELLLMRAEGFNISRILFPIGNDFFNSDNKENTTANGTSQDEDLRWQKTFKLGTELVVDGINLLKQLDVPIDVVVIPGNHDFERSFYLGTVLEAWFDKDELVKVDNGASPRKYYDFGEVLLGFTHGKYEKEASLPMLMAGEEKKLWGNTTFHEWHLGHIHRKRQIKYTVMDKNTVLNEDLGVTIRYMSSLTGTEEWHHKKGFVNQVKAADGFVWNDKTGLIGHLNANFIN